MNMHVSELQRKYDEANKARQTKFFGSPKIHGIAVAATDARDKKLKSQEQRIRKLESQIRDRDLHIADLEASMLRQAESITAFIARDTYADAADTEDLQHIQPRRPIRTIAEEVLRDFPDVTWADVKSIRRERRLTTPRHLCMVAVYEERTDLSLPMIGRHFDRDHTTIMHAIRKYEAERKAP